MSPLNAAGSANCKCTLLRGSLNEGERRNQLAKNEKSRKGSWGEIFKEAGLLIMVFGPLYQRFDTGESGWPLFLDVFVWFLCGIIGVVVGIEMERRF